MKSCTVWLTAVSIFFFCSLPNIAVCQQHVTISTKQGDITGVSVPPGASDEPKVPVTFFYGIPYAKPPTGDLRWQRPVAADAWDEPFNASSKGELGVACMQKLTKSRSFYNISEDCLTLNVYVPGLANSSKKAVMFFIHGGGFAKGAAREYQGEHLTRRGDVVLVTVNYRLSIFGFFDSSNDGIWENLGLWDLKLALNWVKDNIEAFGGDKDRVTIFGGSAGGMATSLMASSPEFNGLFHRVISQSGTHVCPKLINTNTKSVYQKILEATGCDSAECLKRADAEKVIEAASDVDDPIYDFPTLYSFAPFPDGSILKADPFEVWKVYRNGNGATESQRQEAISTFHQYDFMAGFNTQEGSLIRTSLKSLAALEGFSLEDGANDGMVNVFLADYLGSYFPLSSPEQKEWFKQTYFEGIQLNNTPSTSVGQTVMNIFTDLLFGAPALALLDKHSEQSNKSTHMYTFTYKTSGSRKVQPKWFLGGPHTEERIFLFGSLPTFYRSREPFVMTQEETTLMIEMMTSWTNFAKTGDPNGDPVSFNWMRYSKKHQHYRSFGRNMADIQGRLYNTRKVVEVEEYKMSTTTSKPMTTVGNGSIRYSPQPFLVVVALLVGVSFDSF